MGYVPFDGTLNTNGFPLTKPCNFANAITEPENVIAPIAKPKLISIILPVVIIPPSKKDVAVHAKYILEEENISFDLDDLALVVTAGYPDLRKVINDLQRQAIDGQLKIDKDGMLHNEFKLQFLDMIKQGVDLRTIRKFVADSNFTDYTELYRFLYDEVENISVEKLPEIIVDISNGSYQDVLVVDKEINFMATISNILRRLQ